MKQDTKRRQKKLGLSFSGGGTFGYAQMAVFEALEKEGIELSAVTGTSMGSFIAAGVAYGLNRVELYDAIITTDKALRESELFRRKAVRNLIIRPNHSGIVNVEELAETVKPLHKLYDNTMLSDLKLPIAMPAVDLDTGRMVIFSNDPVYFQPVLPEAIFYPEDISVLKACLASSAFPSVISPVALDDYTLVDGGVLLTSPAPLFSPSAIEHVFAVRLSSRLFQKQYRRGLDVGVRSIELMVKEQTYLSSQYSDTDYFMKIPALKSYNFGNSIQMIEAGRKFVTANPINTKELYIEE